jgi:hypothetical protein
MNALIIAGLTLSPLKGINAYLDPGSGSLILQVILAAILGGFLLLRNYWTKVKDGFRKLFNRPKNEEDNDPE